MSDGKENSDEDYLVGDETYDLTSLSALGFLTRAINLVCRERLRLLGEFELSPAQYEMLKLVNVNPGIRQVHAAQILLIQDSNTANLVKDLIAKRLVERRKVSGSGSKRPGLWLTKAGEATVINFQPIAEQIERDVTCALSDVERNALREMLMRIYTSTF